MISYSQIKGIENISYEEIANDCIYLLLTLYLRS